MAQGTTKGVPIDTDPSLTADSDLLVPSQKAIKAYVDSNSSGGGHTIQDNGVAEVQRTNLNFQRMLVTDDAGNDATVVTRPADTYVGITAPASPVEGDVWTNSETWSTYKYYDGFWVEVSNINPSSVAGSGTTNELAYFSGTNTISSLTTGTYPSLTELSYVKGVTSGIQTQLNGKQATLTNPVTGTGTSGYVTYWTGTNSVSGDSNLFWDNTNKRLGIGFTTVSNKLQIKGSNAKAGAAEEIIKVFSNDTTQALEFAFALNNNATAANRYGYLQCLEPSIAYRPIVLQPTGGDIGIGTIPSQKFHVLGNAFFTGYTAIGAFAPAALAGRLRITGVNAKNGATESLLYLSSNDSSGELRLGISLLNNATATLRQARIQVTEEGSAQRDLVLQSDGANVIIGTTSAAGYKLDVFGTTRTQGDFTISDTKNIILGTTTGTKIGTSTSQKIGFFNATPVVQPLAVTTAQGIADALSSLGLLASSSISTTPDVGGKLYLFNSY